MQQIYTQFKISRGKSMFRNIKNIHNTTGILNRLYGKTIRRTKYKSMMKKYGFDAWHTVPYQMREYAWDIVSMINESPDEYKDFTIAEIGCGLGDIIRNINANRKYGIDLSAEVIEAAKTLDKRGEVNWIPGSFYDAAKLNDIDMLITVNFMHEIKPNDLKDMYDSVIKSNNIKYIIADSAKGYQYEYWHDFSYLLPDYEVVSYKTYSYNKRVFLFKKR